MVIMSEFNTVQGRPVINEDWEAVYRKQIRERLADVIGEYLQDEELSALAFYNDLRDELTSWIHYHQKFADKSVSMLSLVNGHRDVEDIVSPDEC